MKKVALVIAFLLVFTLTACSSKPKPTKPTQSSKTGASEPKETEDNSGGSGSVHEPETPDPGYVYEPERVVPEGLPVYPGAVLTFDTEVWSWNEGLHWMWMYEDAGSAIEILEFFKTELGKLGFEIVDSYADDIELRLVDKTETVNVGYSADENDDLNQLGYMITVNLDGWDNR